MGKSVILTIIAYLFFSLGVVLGLGQGGAFALAGANLLGAILTGWYFRHELRGYISRPKWPIALLGSIGILAIVIGLRTAYNNMPVTLSMEAVYNGFAVLSWPLFTLLHWYRPKSFSEKPNKFDLACHVVMSGLVIHRFMAEETLVISWPAISGVGIAILGYCLFNVSIKLSKNHRTTNMAMNVGGAVLLACYGWLNNEYIPWEYPWYVLGGLVVGGISIFMIVRYLGEAYQLFGKRQLSSLVAPLVYDGLLVATAVFSLAVSAINRQYFSLPVLTVAVGMLAITYIRWAYHTKPIPPPN